MCSSDLLTDVLPKGMQFNGVLPQNGVQLRSKGRWTFSLKAGGRRTFTLRVDLSRTARGRKCNVATVSSATTDGTARDITCLRVMGAPKKPNVTG